MFLRLYPTTKLVYLPFESERIEKLTSKFNASGNSTSSSSKAAGMPLSTKKLNGPGYIILNGIRGMNIIALLAVVTASIVMLVKISTGTKLFFFDAVSHVVTAVTSSKHMMICQICQNEKADSVKCSSSHLSYPCSEPTSLATGHS